MATGYLVAAVGTSLQYLSDQGIVLSGGTISTFVAGSTTPVQTFTDSTLGVSNGTVITLTTSGRLPASCWVASGTVIKMVLKDFLGNTIANGTIDNLQGINDPAFSITAAGIGAALYPRTSAEIAAAVTPSSFIYPELNVLRYGALGNDSTDNVTAFTNAQAVAAQYTNPPPIVFPAGIYRIATAQNWFQTGLTIQAQGHVVIKGTGASGNVMTWDAGAATNGEHCFMLGDWNLDSTNAGVTVGLYTRNVHHSTFQVSVRNVVTSAVKIDGAVLNRYKVTCSTNEGNMTTIPANGISINGSAIITQTTDCWFDLTLEGLTGGTGINCGSVSGCTFIGTSEANAVGVLIPAYPNGYNNTFINFDFEANTTLDVDDAGRNNTFINCVANSLITPSVILRATANLHKWIGGVLTGLAGPAVTVTAGAINCSFLQFYCTSTITDNGTNTTIQGVQISNTTDTRSQIPRLINLQGLSGTTVAANNLRGTAVFAGVLNVTVVFGTNESNASYFIALSQSAASSGTTLVPFVTAKAVGGFVINFSAVYTGNVDWILIR